MKFRVASEVERDAGLEAARPAVRIRTGRAVGKVGHRGCSHPDGGLVFARTAEERANLDALALHGTSIPDTVREQGHGRVIPGSFQTLKNGHQKNLLFKRIHIAVVRKGSGSGGRPGDLLGELLRLLRWNRPNGGPAHTKMNSTVRRRPELKNLHIPVDAVLVLHLAESGEKVLKETCFRLS